MAMVARKVHVEARSAGHDRSGTAFLLPLAAYFVLHIVIRVSLSDSLELDEAEQAFVFQQLRLGYGTQPPLYAWLQWLVFTVVGVNLFALSALKNLLLFSTYLCMFHAARPMIGVSGAMAASASLLLLPQIGWESQLDRTHTVLLTSLACATLWCYFTLLRHPTAKRYALFGLLVGLGLQSKYNFAIFIACLASASLLHAQHRHTLWNRKTWIAAAIALLCVLPHGLWLLDHFDAAARGTLQKMGESRQESDYLGNVARGVGSMLLELLAFITPLWLIYGLICGRYCKRAAVDRHNLNARFFIYLYAAFFAWMTILLLSGKVSDLQSRWLQSLLFSLPLAFFVVLPALAQAAVFQRILQVAGVVAVGILLALPLRVYLGPTMGKYMRAHHPYPQLSAELAGRFPQTRILIAGDRLTAGNLYFQRPALRVLLLDEVLEQPERLEGEALLVVRDGTQAGWLNTFRAAYPLSVVQQQGRLVLRYWYGGTETMSFDYALVVARSL